MAFTTPSKNGARLVFRLDPVPKNVQEHIEAFKQACMLLDRAGMDGWTETGRDLTTTAFLPRDPRMYLADDPDPVMWLECQDG